MGFWEKKRVTVTGGAGFLGSHVVAKLREKGCREIFVPRRIEFDLREEAQIRRLYEVSKPEILIHLAAVVGGIGINQKLPGTFFYENAIMGIQLMEWGRRAGVEKFVAVGTTCSYPNITPIPFREEHLWNGSPEETNAPYGFAKRLLAIQSKAYYEQYQFLAVNPIPSNLYGPGDNFDLEKSHVVPAMIRKFSEAEEKKITKVILWGSGNPTRDFLFVEDAVEGILLVAEKWGKPNPINIGSGKETSIKTLAEMVSNLTGFKGTLEWDLSRPDGQPKRLLDISKTTALGYQPKISLEEGLTRTIAWYRENIAAANTAAGR